MYSETAEVVDTTVVGLMLMKVPTSGSMPGGSPAGSREEVLSVTDGLSRTGTEGRNVGLQGLRSQD